MRQKILDLHEIKDTQFGFKCFKKEVVERVFPECRINGFVFDVKVLILARQFGFNIKEIPLYLNNCPESKMGLCSIIEIFLDLLRIRRALK